MTEEQKSYLIGKRYEVEKKTVGEHKGNQYSKIEKELLEKTQDNEMVIRHNDGIPNCTAEKIAKELNISPSTVERSAQYSQAIDTIAENHGEEVKQRF